MNNLNVLESINGIKEDYLMNHNMKSILIIREMGFPPRLVINYKNDEREYIDGVNNIKLFVEKIK